MEISGFTVDIDEEQWQRCPLRREDVARRRVSLIAHFPWCRPEGRLRCALKHDFVSFKTNSNSCRFDRTSIEHVSLVYIILNAISFMHKTRHM